MRCLLVPDKMSTVSDWPSLHASLNRHFNRHHEHNARGFDGGVGGTPRRLGQPRRPGRRASSGVDQKCASNLSFGGYIGHDRRDAKTTIPLETQGLFPLPLVAEDFLLPPTPARKSGTGSSQARPVSSTSKDPRTRSRTQGHVGQAMINSQR